MRDIVITSSVLILAILIIRYLVKGKINPLLQYALWLLVVFRLALPVPLWNSSVSILNLLPHEEVHSENNGTGAVGLKVNDSNAVINMQGVIDADKADDMKEQEIGGTHAADDMKEQGIGGTYAADDTKWQDIYITGITRVMNGQGNAAVNAVSGQNTDAADSLSGQNSERNIGNGYKSGNEDATSAFTLIWLTGIVLVGGYMLFYQIKWKQYLRKNRKLFKKGKKYREILTIYTVKGLPSPCLTGRNIYLTKEMAADKKKLEHILAHEYCHYRHLDSLWVIVRCVLTAVYWFHPLVWVAAYVSKQDSELACDMAAIRMLGEEERIAYGKTLLQLIAGDSCDRSRIGIASTMSGGEKGIRERIALIARKRRYVAAAAGIVVLVAAVLTVVTFTGQAQESVAPISERQDVGLPLSEAESGKEAQQSEEDLAKQQEETRKQNEAETEKQQQEQETQGEEAIEKAKTEAMFDKLSSYDSQIGPLGVQADNVELAGAKDPSDYAQAFYEKGEEALEEGMYLLEERQAADHSDIKIYGMYTKEFGFRGVKTLIGEDVNNFDINWHMSYRFGHKENLSLYERAEDGMPRTFAWKMLTVNSSDSEISTLYLCDRYDTGTIALCELRADDYVSRIQERLQFEIVESENKIIVYDNGIMVGEIGRGPYNPMNAMKKIEDVVIDNSIVGWELGDSEEELRLLIAVGLKLEGGTVWYQGMPFIRFSMNCGYFGERTFTLGQAEVTEDYENRLIQKTPDTTDNEILTQADSHVDVHTDMEVNYTNPCPSYTRISDAFGERVHPATGAIIRHEGVDLAAEMGADIVAAADGIVEKTGYDTENGNYVILYHSANNEYTYYTRCTEILVSKGDTVTKGQKIATVGQTGRSTGPHLHFAVSKDGEYIEPVFE